MENTNDMRVTKRNGELQDIAFDKIQERVKKLPLFIGEYRATRQWCLA